MTVGTPTNLVTRVAYAMWEARYPGVPFAGGLVHHKMALAAVDEFFAVPLSPAQLEKLGTRDLAEDAANRAAPFVVESTAQGRELPSIRGRTARLRERAANAKELATPSGKQVIALFLGLLDLLDDEL